MKLCAWKTASTLVVGSMIGMPLAAQAEARKPVAPNPVTERAPSSADIVNKLLHPGPSDPNVPLPRADLDATSRAVEPAGNGLQLYGRGEQGGGVLGLRLPIPVERGAPDGNTRYGVGKQGSGSLQDAR